MSFVSNYTVVTVSDVIYAVTSWSVLFCWQFPFSISEQQSRQTQNFVDDRIFRGILWLEGVTGIFYL